MVTLSKIYTKTGDTGQTSLGDGTRVNKNSLRVVAYGTVDEANASIGLARLYAGEVIDLALAHIQNDLFDLGADLCCPENNEQASTRDSLRIIMSQVDRLESEIDQMNENLSVLKSFIIPGGSALSAHLHLCRTIVRRAERFSIELSSKEAINPNVIKYLNRLSDWCFVASRHTNDDGASDVLWIPGANR